MKMKIFGKTVKVSKYYETIVDPHIFLSIRDIVINVTQ